MNNSIEAIFETLEPPTNKHKNFFWEHGKIHPFDITKNLDFEMFGIYISRLQLKWKTENSKIFAENGINNNNCIQCSDNFIDGDYFKYFGTPMHTRCIERWMYENSSCLSEKDIRYLARIFGNIYNWSLKGNYNPDKMRILRHFKLEKKES